MNFLEKILSFLKPELKITINRQDNRRIIIQDSRIIIGEHIIEDKETIEKINREMTATKNEETLPFQLIHQDLEKDYSDYEEISIKDKVSIGKLREVLPSDRIECILMARRVLLAIEKGDKILSEQLLKQLEKNHPKDGKKVYNLMSCKYFDEIIIPFIDVFRNQGKQDEHIRRFREFYDGILKFFPIAIFVGNETTVEGLTEEIKKRLKLDVPFIRIHTVGDYNIEKIEEVAEDLNLASRFSISDNIYNTPIGLRAEIYEIKFQK